MKKLWELIKSKFEVVETAIHIGAEHRTDSNKYINEVFVIRYIRWKRK